MINNSRQRIFRSISFRCEQLENDTHRAAHTDSHLHKYQNGSESDFRYSVYEKPKLSVSGRNKKSENHVYSYVIYTYTRSSSNSRFIFTQLVSVWSTPSSMDPWCACMCIRYRDVVVVKSYITERNNAEYWLCNMKLDFNVLLALRTALLLREANESTVARRFIVAGCFPLSFFCFFLSIVSLQF